MKPSEKLYNINSFISLKCVGLNQQLSLEELEILNTKLAKIIKEVRVLEEKIIFGNKNKNGKRK